MFLDFSKAFDKVDYTLLLHKLEHYGIQGQILLWITDFLSERKQQVIVEGHYSNAAEVTSGVPQGSVLGPLLFLLFVTEFAKRGLPHTSTFMTLKDRNLVFV